MSNINDRRTGEETQPLSAMEVADAFLNPGRPPLGRPLDMPGAQHELVATSQGEVATWRAGAGEPVLLVHGWGRDARDLEALAMVLLSRGTAVLALDLPAHGRSAGRSTSVSASARAVLEVQRQMGPTRAVVAHSIGGAVAVEAMAAGLVTAAAVLLASPSRYRDVARRFAASNGLADAQVHDLFAELERRGIELDRVSVVEAARQLPQPALFIHSEEDKVVPFSDSLINAMAWPDSRLLRQRGLGHRRLLEDGAVIDAIVAFIEAAASGARGA